MSKINIEGIVRDINVSTTYLTPLVEAICNSTDAIGYSEGGKIDVILKREATLPDVGSKSIANIIAVDVVDNGIGFTTENRESFDTYKSGLKASQGGKGFGRFMYLKYFNDVTIESTYKADDGLHCRKFRFGKGDNIIIDETDDYVSNDGVTGTTLHLCGAFTKKFIDKGIDVIARKLVEKLLVFFVDSSKPVPIITIKEDDDSKRVILNEYIGPNSDIVSVEDRPITLVSASTGEIHDFSVQVYKIYYSQAISRISLTANKREVTDTPIHEHISEFKETLFEVNQQTGKSRNYSVKAYVIGDFLDKNVTIERDGFKILSEKLGDQEGDLYSDISKAEIEKAAANVVRDVFSEEVGRRSDEKRAKIQHYINNSAPWHRSLINEIDIDTIPMGITDFDLEMKFQRAKYEKERDIRISLHELENTLANEDNYDSLNHQVLELAEKISSASKNDLVHYVCTRKKVIELFDTLRSRKDDGTSYYESAIHNLIYPMGYDSESIGYDAHNLWLLDERLAFSKFTASDKSNFTNSNDAPDLVHFFDNRVMYRHGENNITSPVCIVEFKRPKRKTYSSTDDPIIQACNYARNIQDGKYELPNGIEPIKASRISTPVYIYIVCDITPRIEDFADFSDLTKSPDGERYFGFKKNYNAYIEVVSYKSLIEHAKMRNAIFFEKLGINS